VGKYYFRIKNLTENSVIYSDYKPNKKCYKSFKEWYDEIPCKPIPLRNVPE